MVSCTHLDCTQHLPDYNPAYTVTTPTMATKHTFTHKINYKTGTKTQTSQYW